MLDRTDNAETFAAAQLVPYMADAPAHAQAALHGFSLFENVTFADVLAVPYTEEALGIGEVMQSLHGDAKAKAAARKRHLAVELDVLIELTSEFVEKSFSRLAADLTTMPETATRPDAELNMCAQQFVCDAVQLASLIALRRSMKRTHAKR